MTKDREFLMIIKAATVIGDGREIHIRNYKRLLKIINVQKLQMEKLKLKAVCEIQL